MMKIDFHAQSERPPVRIQADSLIMRQMLAAVLEPYFTITEDAAPLTILCPADGKMPALPGRGKFLVICDERQDMEERIVILSRPLDLEQFLQTALSMYSMDGHPVEAVDYQCNDKDRTVTFDGKTVSLTDKEYALFLILWNNIGEVVPKDTLAKQLWYEGNNNACQVYAAYLRGKLEQIAGPGALISVRGRGYMLCRPQRGK